jgi:hypothetical protein
VGLELAAADEPGDACRLQQRGEIQPLARASRHHHPAGDDAHLLGGHLVDTSR